MKTPEQRLQRLEDVEAIKALKAEYCAYCDDHYNPDGIASLFVPQGVWDGGFMGRFEGVDAIREHFSGVSSIMGFAIHYVTNPLITITDDDPDAATGQWYLWQPCTQTTRRETALWLAARYQETYAKTDLGWRFVEMIIYPRMFAPYDKGWAEVPFLTGGPREAGN